MSTDTLLLELERCKVAVVADGETLRLRGQGRGGPPMPIELLAQVREHKGELLAELQRRSQIERRALEEHALGFARHYIREAWKFLGLVAVDLSELYRAYVEAVQRDPFGDHFGAVSLEVFSEEWDAHELREERAAIITEAEGVSPVEAERAAGFPVEEASKLPLQAQGDQRGGFDPGNLPEGLQSQARAMQPARSRAAVNVPAPVEVFLKQELLFSDRRFEAGAMAELIHPDHRDGLDEADQAWLDMRADRLKRIEVKVRGGDKEALPQLEELRSEALILLAGRVRAVPRGALGRVQEGRRP